MTIRVVSNILYRIISMCCKVEDTKSLAYTVGMVRMFCKVLPMWFALLQGKVYYVCCSRSMLEGYCPLACSI
jgi:hypothetical protein